METQLHSFLKSNLLNKYLIGDTDAIESAEAEYFIAKYSEVKDAYIKLQNNLELLADVDALEAPTGVLDSVLNTIEINDKSKVINLTATKKTPWYSIAASAAAILFATTSFILYQKNIDLNNENTIVVEELYDLRSDIDENNSKIDGLSDPDAQKYALTGNERAKNLKTVAYINAVDKTSMIDIITLPQLPEEQYYQMWAELQGRMVNLGILDDTDLTKLKQIPYMEDASALSITIETKGATPLNNNNEVAEISLK